MSQKGEIVGEFRGIFMKYMPSNRLSFEPIRSGMGSVACLLWNRKVKKDQYLEKIF